MLFLASRFSAPSVGLTPARRPPRTQLAPRLSADTAARGRHRFTRPVNTVGELQKMFSQPRIQSDVRAVLEMDNLGANTAEVNRDPLGGMVMETTIAPGDDRSNGWRSVGEAGRRPCASAVGWRQASRGYQFVIDNLTETLTFFVPKICGNISLVSREPSREARASRRRSAEGRSGQGGRRRCAADAARKAEKRGKRQKRRKRQRHARPPKPARPTRSARLDEERAARKRARRRSARRPNRIGWQRKTRHSRSDRSSRGYWQTAAAIRRRRSRRNRLHQA